MFYSPLKIFSHGRKELLGKRRRTQEDKQVKLALGEPWHCSSPRLSVQGQLQWAQARVSKGEHLRERGAQASDRDAAPSGDVSGQIAVLHTFLPPPSLSCSEFPELIQPCSWITNILLKVKESAIGTCTTFYVWTIYFRKEGNYQPHFSK